MIDECRLTSAFRLPYFSKNMGYFKMAVYKRGKVWYARLYWRDNLGKRHSKAQGGFTTKGKASEWYADALTKLKQGYDIKSNPVFVDYYWHYYKTFKEPKLRPSTKRSYRTALLPLKEYWQQTKLKDITHDDWQEFMNWMGKRYAESSVRMFRKKYHSAIYNAIDDGIITKDFTKRITITGTNKRTRLDKVRMLSVEDIEKLIKLAESRRRTTQKSDVTNLKGNISDYVILTMILTGSRIGEALGLKWHNLHFDTSTIDVHHEYDSDTHQLGPTKTPSSYRTIHVNYQLLAILKELMVNHTDYVFGVSKRQLPPSRQAVDRELIRMMEMLNIPTTAFSNHILRHAHVALLLHWGASIYEIRDRLGHSSIRTTMETYGYLIDESKKQNTKLITDNFSKIL